MDDLIASINCRITDFGSASRRIKITYYSFHIITICCSVINTVISSLNIPNVSAEIITIFSSISLASLYVISNLDLSNSSEFLLYQEKYFELLREIRNADVETGFASYSKSFDTLESSSRTLQASLFYGPCTCK